MLTLRIQLKRMQQLVTLELLEGRPLLKGTWQRRSSDSNTSLKFDSGFWENWAHGTPGGVRTIRLYDPEGREGAHLSGYLVGRTDGTGRFVSSGFGGGFGDGEFGWMLLLAPRPCEAAVELATPGRADAVVARADSAARWKGY